MALYIYGNPGFFVIRDKNDHFQSDVVYDQLAEAISLAIELQKPKNDEEHDDSWYENNHDQEGVFNKKLDEVEAELSVVKDNDYVIFSKDDLQPVFCRSSIYEMVKKSHAVFGKEMSYEELFNYYSK